MSDGPDTRNPDFFVTTRTEENENFVVKVNNQSAWAEQLPRPLLGRSLVVSRKTIVAMLEECSFFTLTREGLVGARIHAYHRRGTTFLRSTGDDDDGDDLNDIPVHSG